MPSGKNKPKIQGSDVAVGNRTLEAVLIDLADQVKANDARFAERTARMEERLVKAEERSARAEEISAEAHHLAMIALQTIANVSKDLHAMTREMREENLRARARIDALEKAAGA